MKRLLSSLLLLVLFSSISGQLQAQISRDSMQNILQKRYGFAQAWGKGYIVSANKRFAFANLAGRLVLPFEYLAMTPLFKDRLMISTHYQYLLVNEEGKILYNYASSPFYVADSQQRKLVSYSSGYRTISNDSGHQISSTDTGIHQQTMIRFYKNTGNENGCGIMDFYGKTILPPEYSITNAGHKLYGGLRNDTLWIYQSGKGLLYKAASFHDFKIFRNDMVFVKKWGAWALMGRNGQLLTKFAYYHIEEFRYPYSIYPKNPSGNETTPDAIAGFALFGQQPKGLINEKGIEVLSEEYDDIKMNRNGWLIVRKCLAETASLLDAKFKQVLVCGAFEGSFVDYRYVKFGFDENDKNSYYDMLLRRYVAKIPSTPIPQKHASSEHYIARAEMPQNRKDSFYINPGLTLLHKVNGQWGTSSVTGETLLPFQYDSAASVPYSRLYYVAKNGKFALLNAEGYLMCSLQLPSPPQKMNGDSLMILKNGDLFKIVEGEALKFDPASRQFDDGNFESLWHTLFYVRNTNENNIPKGIYNRDFKFLVSGSPCYNDDKDITASGLMAITDTLRTKIAVIDTKGKFRIPFSPIPRLLVLRDSGALMLGDTGKADRVYTFSAKADSSFSVQINNSKKNLWFNGYEVSVSHGSPYRAKQPVDEIIMFEGDQEGYFNSDGTSVFVKGLTNVRPFNKEYNLAQKANAAFILVEKNSGRQYMPDLYDSIKLKDNSSYFMFKNGKIGLYYAPKKKFLPPVYDGIGSLNSLENHFLNVLIKDSSFFIDDNWKPILPAWKVPFRSYDSYHFYGWINGIETTYRGRKYKLYATAGDTLKALPDDDYPEGVVPLEEHFDGTVIAYKGASSGVYLLSKKKWIVPPVYKKIIREDDYFFALNDKATHVFHSEGRLMFQLKGTYDEPKSVYLKNQWYMGGWRPAVPVVNNRGKIIVPDTFSYAVLMEQKAPNFYDATTRNNKHAIFDTNGKQMLAAIFDGFSDSWMYDGYLEAYLNGKICLISPQMKQLTATIYKKIVPATEGPRLNYDGIIEKEYLSGESPEPYYFICMRNEKDSVGVIDNKGKEVIPSIYEDIRSIYEKKVVIAKKDSKWGLLDMNNQIVAPFIYDSIDHFEGNGAAFIRGEIRGILSKEGKENKL